MSDRDARFREVIRMMRKQEALKIVTSAMSDNSGKPANSTNGLSFEGLMTMLKGETS